MPWHRADHKAEITLHIAELLRRGYASVHLEMQMRDRDRDRAEWPRLFRERILRQRPADRPRAGYCPTAERLAGAAARPPESLSPEEFRRFARAAAARAHGQSVEVSDLFRLPESPAGTEKGGG